MGPLEEAGKVAGGTVEALKGNPGVLALVVLQFLTIAAVVFMTVERNKSIHAQFEILTKLIDQCISSKDRGESVDGGERER